MVSASIVPVPYALLILIALFSRNGRNRWLGHLGGIAGLVTLALAMIATPGVTRIPWFNAADLSFSLTFLADTMGLFVSAIVGLIGTFVFLYSAGYFAPGVDLRRYYVLLSLFASAMLLAVLSGNLFQLLFAWELVGVSSYLLIGFWKEKGRADRAARKAFLTIIIGDAFFLAGILALYGQYGTFDIPRILSALVPTTLTLIGGIGFLVGAISKSAQFPLHDWLPDAMEGPTPVSAFLHSATMVKLGLFLIARFLPLLALVGLSPWIMLIAVITLLLSASIALVENDIKRVLAYSTMNHLAIILLALSLGATAAAMFHLLTHSIFKALLFFVAGIAIHLTGTQDIRHMGVPWRSITGISVIVGTAALAGLFPLGGFFSKEGVLHAVIEAQRWELTLVFCLAILLSAAYITRWLLFIIGKPVHASQETHEHLAAHHAVHHVTWEMRAPLPILAFLAVIGGFAASLTYALLDTPLAHTSLGLGALSTLLVIAGAGLGYLAARTTSFDALSRSAFAEALRQRMLLDRIGAGAARAVASVGVALTYVDERGINRLLRGIATLTLRIGEGARRMVSGVPMYVGAFLVGFLILLLGVIV